MSAKRIEKEFQEYRREVIPVDAPQVQIDECRKAFYAGAWALMDVIINGLSPDKDPTAADIVCQIRRFW